MHRHATLRLWCPSCGWAADPYLQRPRIPFSPPSTPHPLPPAAPSLLGCLQISQTAKKDAWRKRQRHRPCSVILEGVWRLTQADEGSISCEPKQTVPSTGGGGRTGGGSSSCAGQTRSIIQETEATEEKKAVQTRIRLERLIVFFPVILSSTTENLRVDSFNVCGCECECLVFTVPHSTQRRFLYEGWATFFSQEATWGSQRYSGGTLEPDHFLVLLVSSANDITRQVKAGLILLCLNSCVSCQNSSETPSAALIAGFPFQIFVKYLSDIFEMSVNHYSKSPRSDVMKWKKKQNKTVFSAQNVDVLKFGSFTSTATTAREQPHRGDFWGGDSPRFHIKIMDPKQQNDLLNLWGVTWYNRTSCGACYIILRGNQLIIASCDL